MHRRPKRAPYTRGLVAIYSQQRHAQSTSQQPTYVQCTVRVPCPVMYTIRNKFNACTEIQRDLLLPRRNTVGGRYCATAAVFNWSKKHRTKSKENAANGSSLLRSETVCVTVYEKQNNNG